MRGASSNIAIVDNLSWTLSGSRVRHVFLQSLSFVATRPLSSNMSALPAYDLVRGQSCLPIFRRNPPVFIEILPFDSSLLMGSTPHFYSGRARCCSATAAPACSRRPRPPRSSLALALRKTLSDVEERGRLGTPHSSKAGALKIMAEYIVRSVGRVRMGPFTCV